MMYVSGCGARLITGESPLPLRSAADGTVRDSRNFTKRLSDEGLVDTDVSKTVEVSVSLLLDNVVHQVPVAQQYSGKKGKSGGTK